MAVTKIMTMPTSSDFWDEVRLNRGDLRLLALFVVFRVVGLRAAGLRPAVLGLVFLRVIAQMFLQSAL